MHTKIIQPKTELFSPHGRTAPLYIETGLRSSRERSPSPTRPENVDCECCCPSCCKICAQERYHKVSCTFIFFAYLVSQENDGCGQSRYNFICFTFLKFIFLSESMALYIQTNNTCPPQIHHNISRDHMI